MHQTEKRHSVLDKGNTDNATLAEGHERPSRNSILIPSNMNMSVQQLH